jgi:hypothetical protein
MWMLPSQMKDFLQSLVAVSLFASNIFFWREGGYFGAATEEMPLFHTWSLAVEEQYYVLFPIFLFLAWRFGKNKVFWMIVVFAAISLALSEWGWRNQATANFYLAPTRAWELFAGSIAAFIVQKRGVQTNNSLSLLGLAAILFAIFAYDDSTPFPSIYALVPVLGVVLLILYATKETLATKLLSTKVFVGIGLISYSIYLWHQPLFAFARIKQFDTPSSELMAILSVFTIVLAIASWKYIEQPFRNKSVLSRKKFFWFSTILVSGVIAIGIFGHYIEVEKNIRFSPKTLDVFETAKSSPLRTTCHFKQEEKFLYQTECHYFGDEPTIAVLGNSHATELAYALAEVLKPYNASIKHHTMSGCTHNYQVIGEEGSLCYRWHQIVLDKLTSDANIQGVVISYRNEETLKEEKYRKSLKLF